MKNKKKLFILFLTYGSSLKQWHDFGILERELSLYYKLEKYFDIIIVSYGKDNEYKYLKKDSNIKIIFNYLGLNKIIYSLYLPFKQRKFLKESNFFKTNQLWGTHVAIWVKLFVNKPLILRQGFDFLDIINEYPGNKFLKILFKIYEKISFYACHTAVVTTENIKNNIIKRHKFIRKKIFIIPNFINVNYSNIKKTEKKDHYNFIFAGRLEKQKNLFSLIDTFKIHNSHNLILVGNGALEETIKNYSKDLKNIKYIDRLKQQVLIEEIRKNDFFILPSFYEGHPKILIEAMSTGTPVISSNYDGVEKIIKHLDNGFICDFDKDSMIKTIDQAINLDKNTLLGIAINAQNFVKINYDIDIIVKKELQLYETLKISKE